MDTLLDRFCRYVKVETTAVEETDKYPSSEGQLELGKLLVEEMKELGLQDVGVDKYGIVMGTIPGTVNTAPTIAWLPIVTPQTTVALAPIVAPRRTSVGEKSSSGLRGNALRGVSTFVKTIDGPQKTSSSSVTPR